MRIIDLIREAVPPAKPLQILPQGVQTPPPLTDKDVAPKPSPLSSKNPQLQTPATAAPAPAAAAPAKPGLGKPGPTQAAAAGQDPKNPLNKPAPAATPAAAKPAPAAPNDPAAFGGGVVNPPSKSGVVSKAELDNYRRDSGNPNATLGQYMNQQQGLRARKGGANDPAVIAARQQPAGPPVGSQAQTASDRNELAKFNIAANKPPAAAPAPAATPGTAAAPSAFNQGSLGTRAPATEPAPLSVVSRNDGVPPPLPAEPAAAPAPNSGSGYTGGAGNVQDFGVRGTPILPYGQGSPVGGTTNAVTRTDAEIGDKGVPGSFDKNRAQGEKNLNALKGLFGGNKQPAAPTAAPAGNAAALIPPANPNPLRGQFAESTETQDPVLVRMQNLAGIRR
jgi:hypothetical protein